MPPHAASRLPLPLASPLDALEHTPSQVLVAVACPFASFGIAEAVFEVSGVLACMTSGVVLNALWRVDHASGKLQSTLWEFLEFVLNSLLFTLAGTDVGLFDIAGDRRGEAARLHDTFSDNHIVEDNFAKLMGCACLVVVYALIARAVVILISWYSNPLLLQCAAIKRL